MVEKKNNVKKFIINENGETFGYGTLSDNGVLESIIVNNNTDIKIYVCKQYPSECFGKKVIQLITHTKIIENTVLLSFLIISV